MNFNINKIMIIICIIINIFTLFLIILETNNQKYLSRLQEKLFEIELEKQQYFNEKLINELKQKENQIKQLQKKIIIRVYIIEKDSKDDSKTDDFMEIKID
jgi:CRISPR/Cas system-associated endoribonuclease Cas2